MLFLVLIPGWAWTTLLAMGWVAMAHGGLRMLRVRQPAVLFLLLLTALQGITASSTALGTDVDPISALPCWLGYRGMWLTGGVSLASIGPIAFAWKTWPRAPTGRRDRFLRFSSLWLCFAVATFLAHARSAVLCTV